MGAESCIFFVSDSGFLKEIISCLAAFGEEGPQNSEKYAYNMENILSTITQIFIISLIWTSNLQHIMLNLYN